MRRLFPLYAAAALLAACAPTQSRGADYSALSGHYEGNASLGPIPARYELLLNVNGRTGRADGVLTRLSNGNVYSGNGTFRPYDAQGGMVELKLYQGRAQAGTLSARVQGGKLDGTLKTGLFTFSLNFEKTSPAAPAAAPASTSAAPSVPAPASQVTVETTQTTTTSEGGTSVPVYVIPTPVTPPHP
ncbi:hypothetical protein DKM44_08375 [Deinococcus irradiatisoli]|uniref:Uncharacterized protein n=1 Tax=Deinococcus irradiatisoli TaxID=2202254 RepID=A0A2Z3JDJ0_9DEIO|nr:hypothetical protein [Deinococcus irradiatisoli]AWN23237.1 hypothetical protein DKM44_08375 [Deinococcus irradiatisoli]